MKKTYVVKPSSCNAIKASTSEFSRVRAKTIKTKLTELMDLVESCDAATYNAIDGESLWDSLLTYAQQIDVVLNPME